MGTGLPKAVREAACERYPPTTRRATSVSPAPSENWLTPSFINRVWKCIPDPACPTAIFGENDTSMP